MPLTFVAGDPLLTNAQFLLVAHNAAGRGETSPLMTALEDRTPTAFARFRRDCAAGKVQPGMLWLWRDSVQPLPGFMVVKSSAAGAARLRHFEQVMLTLARDYQRERIESVAIAAPDGEWSTLRQAVTLWLSKSALPVTVYERAIRGHRAE